MSAGRGGIAARVDRLDWASLGASLREFGWARTGAPLLSPEECVALIALYRDDSRFRSRVDMARFRFGAG
ncbi:MAG TPA: proline hydroxylase, partial [Candidatus Dormibacteraeota bacterium]|nr:proline hydroxylase [Candidatus Dormibacteraeota bacterium]